MNNEADYINALRNRADPARVFLTELLDADQLAKFNAWLIPPPCNEELLRHALDAKDKLDILGLADLRVETKIADLSKVVDEERAAAQAARDAEEAALAALLAAASAPATGAPQ